MWGMTKNIFIKFWEGRFIQTKIEFPPEMMENLAKGKWKIRLEETGIVITGEADYMKTTGEIAQIPIPKRKGRV